MKLTQLEQSGCIIKTKEGFTFALDIASYTPLEKLEGVTVDVMIISHLHGDHFSIPHIKKINPKTLYLSRECIELLGEEDVSAEIIEIKVGDITQIGDISVSVFEVDHGPNVKVRPKENFGFLITIEGEKIYFAGDMFYPSGISVTDLEVDYALIPVGGFYTFGPGEAFQFVKSFKSIKHVLPMHFEKTPETKEEFLRFIS
jgi:L-ascorbate metabolism protein UlaG (beta-lactamase superfamily)